MARKTQISKEVILEAAFKMLLRDGYSTISITSLAKEVGCSTQPIAWHFGNMEGLRTELLEHCLNFLKDRFEVDCKTVTETLEATAFRYVELAFDYPNLYKYLYMSEQEGEKMAAVVQSLRAEVHDKALHMLKKECGISIEASARYIRHLQLYVHGIASFTVAKIFFQSKEDVMQMIHEVSKALLEKLKTEDSEA